MKKTEPPAERPAPRRKAAATASVTLRVKQDHLERLQRLADRRGISKSAAIQLAISEMLDRDGR